MQHALEIYSVRVYDPNLPGDRDRRYSDLGNIRGYSLTTLFLEALQEKSSDYIDYIEMIKNYHPGRKNKDVIPRIFKTEDICVDAGVLTGALKIGEYGTKHDIVNRLSGKNKGKVEVNDSVIRNHFLYLRVKPGEKQALLFIQSIRGKGVKSILNDIVLEKVHTKTGGLACQIRPLAHKGTINDWYENAVICEFRVSRFSTGKATQDIADRLGDTYSELTIKPKKRKMRLGKLADLDEGLIDILKQQGDIVKAQVEYNGRRRMFQLGVDDEPVSSVELNEETEGLEFIHGNPTTDSLKTYSELLANDIWSSLT